MKIRKVNDWMGEMTVRTSSYGEKTFLFPFNSVPDWYPYNNNYEWRYSEVKDVMYLIMSESKLEHPEYHIDSNVGRVDSSHGVMSPHAWFCTVVHEGNLEVERLAKELGMKIPRTHDEGYIRDMRDRPELQELTAEDLRRNISILRDYENSKFDTIRKRVRKELTREEEIQFHILSRESRDSFLLSRATVEECEELRMIGKLHVMQNMIGKSLRRSR